MKDIPDGSVDMILADLPYGITARNKWDNIIPYELLWEQYNRIIKDSGVIILFGSGMFTADLIKSNKKYYRYSLIWDKVISSGHLNANRMPLRVHEDLIVFYKKIPKYNPQKYIGEKCHSKGKAINKMFDDISKKQTNYNNFKIVETEGNLKFPKSILTFEKVHPSKTVHPTQKPVALLEYLIKTYTNEGDLVLDNCMGSGSTIIACLNTNRNYIGIELDDKYFEIAKDRIEKHKNDLELKLNK